MGSEHQVPSSGTGAQKADRAGGKWGVAPTHSTSVSNTSNLERRLFCIWQGRFVSRSWPIVGPERQRRKEEAARMYDLRFTICDSGPSHMRRRVRTRRPARVLARPTPRLPNTCHDRPEQVAPYLPRKSHGGCHTVRQAASAVQSTKRQRNRSNASCRRPTCVLLLTNGYGLWHLAAANCGDLRSYMTNGHHVHKPACEAAALKVSGVEGLSVRCRGPDAEG
jgi:hypothetical protein